MAEESKQFVQRQFASGSRLSPDLADQFLETLGFYRKHTPTDSTCLFRVVSEQENGVQFYHANVRRHCVGYMREHQQLFAEEIKWNIQSYLENMTLTSTYGSTLELKALAMFYNANVVIFEPFKHGRWFLQSKTAKSTWRLFQGRDNHFDSVFTLEYMREAAYCQALMYEILYKNVFRMPDVEYAVERMLYDPDDTKTTYEQNGQGQIVATTADGRRLVMSVREDTDCVLTSYRLCHFHHGRNFSRVQRFFSVHGNDAGYRVFGGIARSNFPQVSKILDPLLYDRNISCVRQLLNEGITPFAYKVAKSLDANIYRNVEYDSWMDSIKLRGYEKISDAVFQVGMKCLCQIDGSFRVCRIETIQPDRQICLVRMNNATGSICVPKEALRPYHRQKLRRRTLERRAQTRNTGEPLRNQSQALQPVIEGMQPPAPINEAPPLWDVNAQMYMQMTMPLSAQHEMLNWLTPVGPMESPNHAAAPPIPMSPAQWPYAKTVFSPTQQQELHQEMRLQQDQQEQQRHQQLLSEQQQLHLQLQPHYQLQQSMFPISIFSYNHQSNFPAQNSMYAIVVPVDTIQQHLNQPAVGYTSVSGDMHSVIHHLPNAADPVTSASIETTASHHDAIQTGL